MEQSPSKSTSRRDFLLQIESDAQQMWWDNGAYEVEPMEDKESYLATFPMPYMSGRLHLGHLFTLLKADIAVRYQRLNGKNALLPFAFHWSGMPIHAAVEGLQQELSEQKQGGNYQNLQRMGIKDDEISQFWEIAHWFGYFLKTTKYDLVRMGIAVDWRRSFFTTDVNPYYDSFVRWTFNAIRSKIDFGKRMAIYDIVDKQPCTDHERRQGEGVHPLEHVLVKMQLVTPFNPFLNSLEGNSVFLVAATTRPETVYGLSCCFVQPEATYGAFEMQNGDVFIWLERCAKNMAFQELTKVSGQWSSLLDIPGTELLCQTLQDPLSSSQTIYALPMTSLQTQKATGISIGVPSDVPADWITLQELKEQEHLRDKYKITQEMIDINPISIIEVPGIGSSPAAKMVEKFEISNQSDKEKLQQANDVIVQKSQRKGVMIAGDFKGQKVTEARSSTKDMLIEKGVGLLYFEPESQVITRSGNECVVALCEQWYIKYNEESWKQTVENHIKSENFSAYDSRAFNAFEDAVQWLSEWACSRQYGEGSRIPWDQKYLIDSLSDSTVYMAYYTISYLLQGGIVDGSSIGPIGIRPEELTDEIWDYVFARTDTMPQTEILPTKLELMRSEFLYWYPVKLRVSGKDLIRNHLIMSLYIHAAIWPDKPELWPRSYHVNGHTLLPLNPTPQNPDPKPEKMSKSKGNYLTANDCINLYGADATRIVLADSGDHLDDSTFHQESANAEVLKLTTFYFWVDKSYQSLEEMRCDDFNFFDNLYDNAINKVIIETKEAYENMNYRSVVKQGRRMLQIKDEYLSRTGTLHKDLFIRFITVHLIMV